MNTILSITKKEFRDFFYSPIVYVFGAVFLFLSFWIFFANFFVMGQATLRFFFSWTPLLFLIFLPSITMSRWSEEKKSGTLETLLTLPVREWEVLLGKFLSSWLILGVVLLLTFPLWITVSLLGDLDPGPVAGGYIGLLFLGGACLSIGLFFSSLTENQIIAFITTSVVLFLLYLVGEPIVLHITPGFLKPIFSFLSLSSHFESIARGVIDSRDIIYYLSVAGFFFALNYLSLESRKWN